MSERTSPVQPVPVRAWPKWDEREGYAFVVQDWPVSQIGEWKCITIPLGAEGNVLDVWSIDSLVEVIERSSDFGPLRSIRVLLSTGHEVTVKKHVAYDSAFQRYREEIVWGVPGVSGTFWRDLMTDTEAVEKALAAAIAWVEGQAK